MTSETMVQVIQNEIGSERVVLKKIYDECVKCSHWTQEDLKSVIVKSAIDFGKKRCYEVFRIALTYKEPFGSILEIAECLGREITISKLSKILELE